MNGVEKKESLCFYRQTLGPAFKVGESRVLFPPLVCVWLEEWMQSRGFLDGIIVVN